MTKILIVEDEQDIAEGIALFFQSLEFDTLHLDEGSRVIDVVKTEQPDLIILDLMLPNKDGLTCCREIREFSNVPIIMLTAKVEQVDKLVGLKSGADDYLCKPFDAMELVLRAQAILNRTRGQVQFNPIVLDEQALSVMYNGDNVNLSSLEFALFSVLFNAPGRVYSREQIIKLAYPDERDISDRVIDSHIKKIRNKFKLAGAKESVIHSVYGAGYRFE